MTKLRYGFFFIFTILNTYASLIFHAKIQPKISSGSGEEVHFVVFAIFSSPGPSRGRAIALPPASALASALASVAAAELAKCFYVIAFLCDGQGAVRRAILSL